jgi:hypothetical protein
MFFGKDRLREVEEEIVAQLAAAKGCARRQGI